MFAEWDLALGEPLYAHPLSKQTQYTQTRRCTLPYTYCDIRRKEGTYKLNEMMKEGRKEGTKEGRMDEGMKGRNEG